MEEKKLIYQVVVDCWNIAKQFLFEPINDSKWDDFIEQGNRKSQEYKEEDEATKKLFCSIFNDFVIYKETKERERKNAKNMEKMDG